MVTSSAVVGSSAISRAGRQISAMAIMARWRMPPESSNGYMSIARFGSGKPTRFSISIVRSRRSALVAVSWIFTTSPIWLPIVCSGDSEVIGSWKILPMRLPRMARISAQSGGSFKMSVVTPGRLGSENRILPVTFADRGRMPITAWLMTDLPEPDSPTSAVTLPGRMRRLARLTA